VASEVGEALARLPHQIGREQDKAMEMSNAERMGTAMDVPEISSTERAMCELCGDVISTTNRGRHTGLAFLPFERLLDLHMEQRHANVCVLPVRGELRLAA
jgi:uncharacterized paraquat-inducible protein A